MPLNNWMSAHWDKKLRDLVLPGSHDAGTIAGAVEFTLLGSASNTVTQDLSIPDQLTAGTRFFDLRFSYRSGRIVPHHTTGGQGGYGTTTFETILDRANDFCQQFPTEIVVFRISHTSTACAHAIYNMFQGAAAVRRWQSLNTCRGNLCTKRIGELASKGGLILILEASKFGRYIDQNTGLHSYTKFKNGGDNPNGIATCGCFDGGHAISGVIRAALRGQEVHAGHSQDHLWQVYWQKTYKNPWSSTGIERGTRKVMTFSAVRSRPGQRTVHGGTHATTDHMLDLLQHSALRTPTGRLPLPNIWSYDFVNTAINSTIVALNRRTAPVVGRDMLSPGLRGL